ncbi:MAG: HPr kinase/phosphatase C-terminal domain-containing protein [Pseudomonadota bacterium]
MIAYAAAPVPLHASAVAFGDRGLLILGPSGAGKTRLALELIALGAELVGDDRVILSPCGAGLSMRPAPALAGLVEIRGAGILRHPHRAEAPLWLALDLGRAPVERMGGLAPLRLEGIEVPCLAGAAPLHAAAVMAMLRTGALPDADLATAPANIDRRHG